MYFGIKIKLYFTFEQRDYSGLQLIQYLLKSISFPANYQSRSNMMMSFIRLCDVFGIYYRF